MISKFLADQFVKPGKSPLFSNPNDYGLDYEDVEFKTSDNVTLKGWLIPGDEDKVIIQNHVGAVFSRNGYTPEGKNFLTRLWPENIDFLRQAKALNDAGYTVLMYDFRNHGESQKGKPETIFLGSVEKLDVRAAIDFIISNEKYQNAKIGLLSICMGLRATGFAYLEEEIANIPNIKALFGVQPINNNTAMKNGAKAPEFMVRRASNYNIKRGGVDIYSDCLPASKVINVPTYILQNENDPMTDIKWVKEFYNNLNVEKELNIYQGVKSRFDAYNKIGAESEMLVTFFDKYMK